MTLRNRIRIGGNESGIVDASGINDSLVAWRRARRASTEPKRLLKPGGQTST